MPREMVEALLRTSLSLTELLETMEVALDKDTVRRLKLGELEYKKGNYVTASSREEIDKVLSS